MFSTAKVFRGVARAESALSTSCSNRVFFGVIENSITGIPPFRFPVNSGKVAVFTPCFEKILKIYVERVLYTQQRLIEFVQCQIDLYDVVVLVLDKVADDQVEFAAICQRITGSADQVFGFL